MEPTVATMNASCIVKDEGTGVTYMDTMTGVSSPQCPQPGDPSQGAHHRGYYRPLIMD